MKKKIFGIFICMLVIAIRLPISTSTTDDKLNNTVDESRFLMRMLPYASSNLSSGEYALTQKDSYTQSPLERGWSWLSSYPNYAPSGLPDFYQKQDQWKGIVDGGNGIAESTAMGDDVQIIPVGQPMNPGWDVVAPGQNCALESTCAGDDYSMWMFCCAVSTANCFWWLDSKYDNPDGFPGDGEDEFSLVEDYGAGDDHVADNAPLFIMEMANALNITSTLSLQFDTWSNTINTWFADAGLGDLFELNLYTVPTTYNFIAEEIEQGKCVILIIYFCTLVGGQCVPVLGHAVTCAGVNVEEHKIALSDPLIDIENPGGPSHNDPQFVSYDIYNVAIGSPCPNYPEIEWWLPEYWPGYTVVVYETFVINTTNEPPDVPSISGETNGKVQTEYEYTFNAVDTDADDVKFFIDWGDGNQESTAFIPSGTDIELKHKWDTKGTYNITAKAQDTNDFYSLRGIVQVTIEEFLPPNPPTITGPAKGKIKVATNYNFTTADSNGDEVYYYIEWGDGSNSSWIGPYPSGDVITKSHTWSKKGTYIIKAKAKDIDGNESDWTTLSVTMPFSYNIPFMHFWMKVLERFPNAFPLLRYIMGY